jgi:hypothetical protein
MKRIVFLTIASVALAAAPLAVRAADTTNAPAGQNSNSMEYDAGLTNAPADLWQLGVTVPLWAAGINGNATLRGRQQDVNVSFNTLREHLDASFALGLDLNKGKFDIYSDVGYMKFSGNFGGSLGGKTDADLKFVLADAGVAYVLVKAGEEHPFVLAGTVGVRYWYADTALTFRGPLGNVTLNGGKTYDVVDPVIGLRASQYLTQKLHLDFSGDYGGFDISHDTDITWSATGMFTYDFAKWFSLSAGYKAVGLDESEGSGVGKNGVNLIFNGALIAATLKF